MLHMISWRHLHCPIAAGQTEAPPPVITVSDLHLNSTSPPDSWVIGDHVTITITATSIEPSNSSSAELIVEFSPGVATPDLPNDPILQLTVSLSPSQPLTTTVTVIPITAGSLAITLVPASEQTILAENQGLQGTVSQCSAGEQPSEQGCVPCPPESFQPSVNNDSCSIATVCTPGTRVAILLSDTVDRTCVPCDDQTFSSKNNSEACTAVAVCPIDAIVVSPPTVSSDTVCQKCPEGTFKNGDVCTAVSGCQPGTRIVKAATSTVDSQCTPCILLFDYQPQPDQQECIPTTVCEVGEVENAAPTLTSDRECEPATGTGHTVVSRQLTSL